ncbi:MAG: hypothetical protein A3J74_10220 [Elusimicrobia bacterium RIFCSPHIGHO2_02_FULL_57_9]|nr:MAG: hypothetical protein A3J74_10220 [Elusimicrobia bacterium RIFCSPHIGHO2_02_FULL_57_9]
MLVAVSLPLQALAVALTAEGVEERLIIAFKSEVSAQDQRMLIKAEGLRLLREIPALNMVLVRAPKGRSALALSKLSANSNILRVDRDIWRNWLFAPASMQETPLPSVESVVHQLPKFTPSSRMGKQDEEAQWGIKRVNAPAAWPSNQGAGVKVAVIDTGIDKEHPELKIIGGYNALDKNASWDDDHFHGTHVSGIIAARLNGELVAGVAPQVELYAVKVLSKDGSGSLFSIIEGIIWAAQQPDVKVINMSLGANQELPFVQQALQMAQSAGIAIVCAAGNGDGKGNSAPVGWPAAYEECIAVSALSEAQPNLPETITKWSSRGPEVDFIAPGEKIPSTVPKEHDAGLVKAYSGTSMACPHVAALAALAVKAGASSPQAVRSALERAAASLPNLSASEQGRGVINAANIAR